MGRWGLPYMGSKNAIAQWVVDVLPAGENFVDLFAGGCAVTHCAANSYKWEKFIVNDIAPGLTQFFVDVIHGDYTVEKHPEWISRAEFDAKKATDAYIGYCWSFGNNRVDYMYGREIEPFKRALHYAVIFNDTAQLDALGIEHPNYTNVGGVVERYRLYKGYFKNAISSKYQLENLERLQNLERLELSYEQVEIPPGSIVYCDIPYRSTNCGSYAGFDHERFYKWALHRNDVFISEYEMPDDFVLFAEIERLQHLDENRQRVQERIYTTKETLKALAERETVPGEQLTLF